MKAATRKVRKQSPRASKKSELVHSANAGARPTLKSRGLRNVCADNTNYHASTRDWSRRYADERLELEAIRAIPDEREAQADLLVKLDEHRIAARIRSCGTLRYPCRQRLCPACSQRKADAERVKLWQALPELREPTTILLKILSDDLSKAAFSKAWEKFTEARRALKRRKVFRGVKKLAGMIETVPIRLTSGRWVWSIHLHAFAEVETLDVEAADAAWKKLTGKGSSEFSTQPLRDGPSFAEYILKTRDRCPSAHRLRYPAWLLKVLIRAAKDKQHWVTWGALTERGKKRKAEVEPVWEACDPAEENLDEECEDVTYRVPLPDSGRHLCRPAKASRRHLRRSPGPSGRALRLPHRTALGRPP